MNKYTNKIESKGNGVYEVSISFDITEHGHSYGMPRNYPLDKIQKLIRSQEVKKAIENGYALCMYGHMARHKKQGYLANEANAETGTIQEPIGKVTQMSIKDRIISYKMTLVETSENKVKSVVKFIENSIGGFSAVWDVKRGVFYGFDFVLSPNFNGNRVVMDSICSDGSCQLGSAINDTVLDAIGEHEELYNEAKDLLEHQDSVMGALKVKDKLTAMQDNITALKAKVSEQDIMLENKDIDIKAEQDAIKDLTRQYDFLNEITEDLEKTNTELEETNTKLKDENKELENTFMTHGVKAENGTLTLDSVALGDLLAPSSGKYSREVDSITMDSLREAKKQPKADPMADVKMTY